MKKTKRTRKWHKKITMKELRHINEWCGGTLAGIRRVIKYQRAHEIRCWDCLSAARKLDLLPQEEA